MPLQLTGHDLFSEYLNKAPTNTWQATLKLLFLRIVLEESIDLEARNLIYEHNRRVRQANTPEPKPFKKCDLYAADLHYHNQHCDCLLHECKKMEHYVEWHKEFG